jgi:hypothetical protein
MEIGVIMEIFNTEIVMEQSKNFKDPLPCTVLMPRYPNFNLNSLVQRISSITYRSEYEMVRRGFREANIFHLTPNNYDNQIDQIGKDKLVFRPIRRSKQYGGFSHKHFPSDKLDQNTMIFGVVAKDWDIATEFKDADLGINSGGFCDHKNIAKYLGYPECCAETFTEDFKTDFDPVYPSALRTEHITNCDGDIVINNFDPFLQTHLRYFGLKIIPWFPCSYTCEESSKRAKQWFSVIESLDENLSKQLKELIEKPSSWDLNLAQVVVKHPDFRGYCTSYYNPERRVIIFDRKP